MSFISIRRLVLAVISVLLYAHTAFAATNDHVVLITIDGFAAYMMSDPKASLPNLRRMATEGSTAEGMKVSNPAVTWPNHTTLVTGVHPIQHSVLFNGVLVRPGLGQPVRVDGKRDKRDLVAVPTLYDVLHREGYRTAGINWPCTRNSGTLEDDFPDVPDQVTHSTPRLRSELIAAGLLKDATDKSFTDLSSSAKDHIWTSSAVHVIKARKPNLLLLHMLVTDSIQHKYGPQSPAAYAAMAQADAQVGLILQALGEAGIRERTTVIVTADHGFATALKILNPNVLFRKADLLEIGPTNQIAKARVQIISEGGTAMVYLTNPETLEADRGKVRSVLRDQEGIADMIGPSQFGVLGLPDPAKNRQMADLILVAKDGYAFNNNAAGNDYLTFVTLAEGNQGHHGYISTNPKMNASFIVWGRGVKRGARIGLIENVDIAPTIAKLLGVNLNQAQGQPLKEILSE